MAVSPPPNTAGLSMPKIMATCATTRNRATNDACGLILPAGRQLVARTRTHCRRSSATVRDGLLRQAVAARADADARRRRGAPDRSQGVVIRLKAAPASNGTGPKSPAGEKAKVDAPAVENGDEPRPG